MYLDLGDSGSENLPVACIDCLRDLDDLADHLDLVILFRPSEAPKFGACVDELHAWKKLRQKIHEECRSRVFHGIS